MDSKHQQKEETLKEIQSKDFEILRDVAKKEWIKTSFWVPENTPILKDDRQAKIPSRKLICPIYDKNDAKSKHVIKFKELISLKFSAEKGKNQIMCWLC